MVSSFDMYTDGHHVFCLYYCQVKTDENNYVHLKIYQNLQQTVSLSGYELNKNADDEITFIN